MLGLMRNFHDFLDKYRSEGASMHEYSLETIRSDWQSLPSKERYRAISYFKNFDDHELLRTIVCYDNPVGLSTKSLFKRIDILKEQVLAKISANKDDWEIRTSIAEGLFCIGEQLAAVQKNYVGSDRPSTQLEKIRQKVYKELSKIYLATTTTPAGNKYWDTDGDFDSHKIGFYEYFFDDKDSRPLDDKIALDSDMDGMDDTRDPLPNDPNEWNEIKIGEKITSSYGDVTRTGQESYQITYRVHLEPDDTLKADGMEKKLHDPEYLEMLKEKINRFYAQHREESANKIDFTVHFVSKAEMAHGTVRVAKTMEKIRSSSEKWQVEILDKENVMLHEIIHLMGLGDLYHEQLVHGKLRDHTLQPGFELIDPQNIMLKKTRTVVRSLQMKDIIINAYENRINDRIEEAKPGDADVDRLFKSADLLWEEGKKEEAIEVLERSESADYSISLKLMDRYYELGWDFKLEATVNDNKFKDSPIALKYRAMLCFRRGDVDEGKRLYKFIISERGNRHGALDIVRLLVKDKKINLAEDVAASYACKESIPTLVETLYDEGEYEYALMHINGLLKEYTGSKTHFKIESDFPWFDVYMKILARTKNYGRIEQTYKDILSRDPYDLEIHCKIIEVCLDAGNYQNAVVWVRNTEQVAGTIKKEHRILIDMPEKWEALRNDPRIKDEKRNQIYMKEFL